MDMLTITEHLAAVEAQQDVTVQTIAGPMRDRVTYHWPAIEMKASAGVVPAALAEALIAFLVPEPETGAEMLPDCCFDLVIVVRS